MNTIWRIQQGSALVVLSTMSYSPSFHFCAVFHIYPQLFLMFSSSTHTALPLDGGLFPSTFLPLLISLLYSLFPRISVDPVWPPWQASCGIPHSNSVVQPSSWLIRWPCTLKRHSLLWLIVTLSLVRVCLKCCKSAPIMQCKRTPGLGISPLDRTYTEPRVQYL